MDQHNSPIKSAYHTFLFGKGGPYVKCTKTSFVPQVTWSPRNCYEDIFCWSHIGIKNFSCRVMILFLEKKNHLYKASSLGEELLPPTTQLFEMMMRKNL